MKPFSKSFPSGFWETSWGKIIRLGIPISATRALFFAMATVDTVMLSRSMSVEQVAYYGLGVAPQFVLLVTVMGFAIAIAVLTAQSRGAGKPEDCGAIWRAGNLIGLAVGILAMFASEFGREYLEITGQTQDLAIGGGHVLSALGWGMPAIAVMVGTILYLETIGEAKLGVITLVIGNLVNVGLNLVMLTNPVTAAEDAAAATSIARWVSAGIAVFCLFVISKKPEAVAARTLSGPDIATAFKRTLVLGIPIVGQTFLETTAFALIATFAGWAGTVTLAAYQISLNFIAQTYMLAIGFGTATAVFVGQASGRGDMAEARHMGWIGIRILLVVMMPSAIMASLFPETLASVYTDDDVLKPMLVASLIVGSGVVILDGLQGVALSALRGAGDVRIPTWFALATFWGVIVPSGWLFGIYWGMDAPGLMLGLGLGLGLAGVLFCYRFHRLTQP